MSHPVTPPGPPSGHAANPAPSAQPDAGAPYRGEAPRQAAGPGQAPYRAEAPQAPQTQRAQQPTTMAYTNTFAIVAVILGFMQPIAGIVFGHLALGQIKRNGDTGRGLALTGLIVGYAMVAFWIAFIIFYVVVIFSMIASLGSVIGQYSDPYSF